MAAVCTVSVLPKAGDGDLRERRRGGEPAQFRQPAVGSRALRTPGPAALAGALRRQAVQGGVLPQPGGPGDVLPELLQFFAGVGGISDGMQATAGQRGREAGGHAAG